jgi:tetratricopeptide (TPR) repeat protein
LDVAHGHPKLLELADGQASHPERLTALVQAGGQAWQEQGKLPHGFFTADAATTKPSDYLNVLAAWTNTVTDTLSPGERDLFWFLCCLEEADRFRLFVKIVWSPLWQKLGREGSPPELDQSLAAVAICGLVTLQKGTDGKRESYGILPGVAAAARDYAGKPFQNAVDEGAAVYWLEVLKHASGNTGNHTVHSDLAVRAGLGSVPYLIRQGHWLEAAITSERAFILEPSRRNAAILLPAAREITRHEPSMAGQLASILQALGESTAEQSLRAAMSDALARRDHLAAMALAERLASQCMHSGKLGEALAFAEQMAEHSRLASLGPWTVLAADVRRLEVLSKTENPGKILLEAQRLHRYAKTLSIDPGPPGSADPQVVQDTLYEIGGDASLRLGRWDLALKFNATFVTRLASRHEPADTIAIARFNDYGPLLRLGRTEEALTLLLDCKRVFQDAGNIAGLARSFMALADIEESRGHGDAAIRLVRDALRYHYQIGDVISIASAYHSLGGLVAFHIRQHAPALANHLIAAVIRTLADVGGTDDESAAGSLRAAASALRAPGMTMMRPVNIADLCRRVSDIPGTNPAALIAKLSPDPETAERTLQDLIAQARN